MSAANAVLSGSSATKVMTNTLAKSGRSAPLPKGIGIEFIEATRLSTFALSAQSLQEVLDLPPLRPVRRRDLKRAPAIAACFLKTPGVCPRPRPIVKSGVILRVQADRLRVVRDRAGEIAELVADVPATDEGDDVAGVQLNGGRIICERGFEIPH